MSEVDCLLSQLDGAPDAAARARLLVELPRNRLESLHAALVQKDHH